MKLLLNRIKTPDGTILTSYYTHDFVTHTDANGELYGVDGGTSYAKRIGNCEACEDLSVWVHESKMEEEFDIIRETVHWGTRGKEGDQPLRWVKISEMSDEHLDNLVNVYKGPIDSYYRECFEFEIKYRAKNAIIITE